MDPNKIANDTRVMIGALGAFFLGAVYLAGVIAAGIAWGNPAAVWVALSSAGLGYLVQIGSMLIPQAVILLQGLWLGAVGLAIFAGTLLIAVGA